jgi:hypothetical protein
MASPIRVMLELGKNRKKFVASAFDWPGWDRGAKTETDALAVLESYRSRYAPVAERAGLASAFAAGGELSVVERVEGTGMTDFYTLSMKPATAELEPMSPAECDRKLALLRACWAYFDDMGSRVSAELRKGPRGGGRERDAIKGHVNRVEMGDFAWKVGLVVDPDAWEDPDAVAAHRDAFSAAIRDYNARGAPARTWTVQFVLRHAAYHILDHAWEMEDRDLSGDPGSNAGP